MSSPGNFVAMNLSALSSAQTSNNVGVALNGTVPFSVAAWLKLNGLAASSAILNQPGGFDFGFVDNCLQLSITGFPVVQSNPLDLGDGNWHYVCVTFDGSSVRFFIDGVFDSLQGCSGSGTTNTLPFTIGANLQALVQTVMVYDTNLSSDVILQAMFNPPVMTNVVAWFDFTQAPPLDRGPNHLPIELRGGAVIERATPSLRLERTAYARPLHQASVNPGGQQVDPYTIQAWIRVESDINARQVIFANSDLVSDTGMALYLQATTNGYVLVSQRGANVTINLLSSTITIPRHAWVNVATTFDGVTLTLYINGLSAATAQFGPIPLLRNDSDLLIGTGLCEGDTDTTVAFQGYIARVDVWGRALTAAEIAASMDAIPALDAPGLQAIYDFTHVPACNVRDSQPVALAEGATLSAQTEPVTSTSSTDSVLLEEPFGALDAELLTRLGSGEPFGDFLSANRALFDAAMDADLSAFADVPHDRAVVAAAWSEFLERTQEHPESLPLRYTLHELGEERFLICHSARHGSYIAYRGLATDLDDCTLWKIQLIFVIVAGAIDAIFAIRCFLTPRAVNYVAKIIMNPRIMVLITAGTVTAGTIFAILAAINSEGFLVELFKLIVQVGFWTILRVTARIVLMFFGIGAADIIASLIATAALLIYTLTQRPASCSALPTVDLAAVKFNYDPTSVADGLNLRRNYTTSVAIPEWTKGKTVASDSPAAYSITSIAGTTVAIQAKFVTNTQGSVTAQVQASGGGILGAIDPITVTFVNGVSTPEFVRIPLNHQTLAANGVQLQDVTWNWSYKVGSGNWTSIGNSVHRIYAILGLATMPWLPTTGANDPQTPWTDVLDYACVWASGKTNSVDASTVITQKVYGAIGLTYDMSQGASRYTQTYNGSSSFLCSSFVGYLRGGAGPRLVNCTDCASIVSTFANAIGCNITESTMYPPTNAGFLCNEIIAIGQTTWAYPFSPSNRFSYHEVGRTGSAATATVYDACLQVDASNNPWLWPGTGHTPILATNMAFTTLPTPPTLPIATPFTAMSYRERLAQNNAQGIGSCIDQGPWSNPNTQNGRRRVI